jgi:hypothetical protein
MRFFTMAWWCGDETDEDADPAADYAAHLAAIRDRLTPDLLAVEELDLLHDARLRELRLVVAGQSLSLALDTCTGDERLTFLYGGVEWFESSADPEAGLGGPAGYGVLGYWEVDILPGGAFEHRLLFSTGIELVVAFGTFKLQRTKHV